MSTTSRAVLLTALCLGLVRAGAASEPDLSWLNQREGPRPTYAWENREDSIYHEMWYEDEATRTAPEIWPIMRGAWVFNRAMRWREAGDGTVLAWSEGGDLALTGPRQASRWYSDPANEVADEGEAVRFVKRSTVRRRDAVVLPSFQFHLGQHPVLRLAVTEASDDWQLVVSVKGRSGAPFLSSGWQRGPRAIDLDIAGKLRELGYETSYAELHFAMGVWARSAAEPSTAAFTARLLARPAVVGCLPVVRTEAHAKEGVPVSAVVTDERGVRLGAAEVSVFAVDGASRVPLREADGAWTGVLAGLGPGDHPVRLVAEAAPGRPARAFAPAQAWARVTDGVFARYDRAANLVRIGGRPAKPLSGSFQGTFFHRDAGLASERMVETQADWDEWDRSVAPGEHQHYWESLRPAELARRFAYLARNRWDLAHLHSHYGIWERFDAFGNPAPHGVEQLAAYVRAASAAGLRVMVTLSSYPYSAGTHAWDEGTTPYAQTLESGFRNEDWFDPAREPFNGQYRRYVTSFVRLFRDETAIFSFSSSGEGDWKNGPARFLDTQKVIRSVDTEHLVVSEPVMNFQKLPASQVAPYPSDLVGMRNYALGAAIPFEQHMGIQFRLGRMVPNMYLAEGSFPSSHLYTALSKNPPPYVGTREYRIHVRDTLYLGLVHRMPLLVTWDEVFTEDERRVLAEARERFDWTQPLEEPAVAVVVGDAEAKVEAHGRLGPLEAALTRLPLDYRFVADRRDARPGETVVGARKAHEASRFASLDRLPARLRERVPFTLSAGWSASYCLAKDRRSMLAYVYNTAAKGETSFYLGANKHRRPAPAELRLGLRGVAPTGFVLFDLETKAAVQQGAAAPGTLIREAATVHDYLLLLAPEPRSASRSPGARPAGGRRAPLPAGRQPRAGEVPGPTEMRSPPRPSGPS